MRSQDTQKDKPPWSEEKTWVFSVWYNERYAEKVSVEEWNHCWQALMNLDVDAVEYILYNPKKFFDDRDFEHLGSETFSYIRNEWEKRRKERV